MRDPRHTSILLSVVLLVNAVGFFSLYASLTSYDADRSIVHDNKAVVPVRLIIPSINVDAPITQVGLRPDGLMDIPNSSLDVGWFSLGFLPGTQGNSVIAGHLDTQSGNPAVFWNLRRLKAGDTVEILFNDESSRIFTVTHRKTFAADDAPLVELFGSSTGAHLNLITCHGIWEEGMQMYDRRLVVFTEEL